MPDTFTPGGILLIGDGERAGTWGSVTNTNLQIFDRMVSQAATIALSGTTHTLTVLDGVLSDGHYGVLVFGGSPSGTNTVTISPADAKRTFFVKNDSGQTVILTQGSGGNVTVETGRGAVVYCDGAGSGAAVVDLSATFAASLASLGVTASAAELNILDGATVSTAEVNILDGVTATTAELNILDGVTATAAELNILDGVTATTAELNLLDGVTWTLLDYNTLTATAAELNILDGATLTTTELNFVDGVTSSIQTQLDAKAANTTQAEATWETGTSTTETIVSPAKVAAAIAAQVSSGWTESAVQNVTGLSNVNFTSLPSGLTEIEILFYRVSANVGLQTGVQLSVGGSFVTSGYQGEAQSQGTIYTSPNNLTFILTPDSVGVSGAMRLYRFTSNTWISDHNLGGTNGSTTAGNSWGGGSIALGGTLDGLRLRADPQTYDAGQVKIRYR